MTAVGEDRRPAPAPPSKPVVQPVVQAVVQPVGQPVVPRKRGQGQLEAQVLAVLRTAPGPATAAWVRQQMNGGVAHTTVLTILSRLHGKRAVARTQVGRSYRWNVTASAAELAAQKMKGVLDNEQDRHAVLASFVDTLAPGDEDLLRLLLARTGGPHAA